MIVSRIYTFIILVSTAVKKQSYVRTNKRVQKLAQKAKNFPCDLLGDLNKALKSICAERGSEVDLMKTARRLMQEEKLIH